MAHPAPEAPDGTKWYVHSLSLVPSSIAHSHRIVCQQGAQPAGMFARLFCSTIGHSPVLFSLLLARCSSTRSSTRSTVEEVIDAPYIRDNQCCIRFSAFTVVVLPRELRGVKPYVRSVAMSDCAGICRSVPNVLSLISVFGQIKYYLLDRTSS